MGLAECLDGTDALAALNDAYAAAWTATDRKLLELCRDRVAMLLRHRPTLDAMSPERFDELTSAQRSERFTERERAALDFTEQYVVDVTAITDGQAERLGAELGDEGLVDFVNALLVVEQRMTLELALDGALGSVER